jgi:Flp pilus assembly pilin Flp
MTYLKGFIHGGEGQDLVEYALLLGFVALAISGLLFSLGGDIGSVYTATDGKIKSAATGGQ